MTETEMTSMQVTKRNLERLEKLKEHSRIPHDEILKRLLDYWERYAGTQKGEGSGSRTD